MQQPNSVSDQIWKEALSPVIPAEFAEFINGFETNIHLKKQGKTEDKIFAETRLRMGAYGQRYDNGKRHDGTEVRSVGFPDPELGKGPETFYHAPGMQRIKLPYGRFTLDQMEVMADLAEEYSDSILHVTTRQDIQLHYVHLDDTPSMYRRLATVGITTREACGNSVRNITACPKSGVCGGESFDLSAYGEVLFRYLLGHPDVQDFGRKFKIALSGCEGESCGLTNMHDLGLIGRTKNIDGITEQGFTLVVGGGLGAVPYGAKVYEEFLPANEVLHHIRAICRVYARLGEKKKRHRARIKFLVADMGIEAFRETVKEELKTMPIDPKWEKVMATLQEIAEPHLDLPEHAIPGEYGLPLGQDKAFDAFVKTNVAPQRQLGYSIVTIRLPLGDMTSAQTRALVDLVRSKVGDTVRTTVEQNLVVRWVPDFEVHAFFEGLKAIGLAHGGAATLVDITSCPGTDTCKLGIASSRGLSAVLMQEVEKVMDSLPEEARQLRIKTSGCFNSCGQQQLADIGFHAISRNVKGYVVPHFQLNLGGEFSQNGLNYGTAIGGFPSKAIPQLVFRLIDRYLKEKQTGESFRVFTQRLGKVNIMESLKDLTSVPDYEQDKSYYTDWGDIREFSVKDKGIGECAGEVVTLTDFGLTSADREIFGAQILWDEGKATEPAKGAYIAMRTAAQALIKRWNIDISDDDEAVFKEFKTRLVETSLINDPFGGDRFAQYYLHAYADKGVVKNDELAGILLEEAKQFIESCHACNTRLVAADAQKAKV
jgi:sulfite reductase (ferredoxin)